MIERLLRELDSAHVEVREAALQQIRALPPEKLLRLAQTEALHWRRRRRRTFLRTLVLLLLPVLLAYLTPLLGADYATLCLLLLPAVLFWNILAGLPNPAHRTVGMILTELQDPRFIGPAVEMLLESNVSAANATMSGILRSLKRMIPQLRADQADLLTREQKRALVTLLQTPYADFDMVLSILKALEQVGDESAIPAVEKLAAQSVTRVRRAAEDCLRHLHLSAKRARQVQTLLRASCASDLDASEALLRPATVLFDTPPEEMLRATLGKDATPEAVVYSKGANAEDIVQRIRR